MKDCIVCVAYPNHRGTHYSSHDAMQMLSAERGHSMGAVSWTPLPGVVSAEGNRILVTTNMATEGEAHPVEGLWRLEQSQAWLPGRNTPVSRRRGCAPRTPSRPRKSPR